MEILCSNRSRADVHWNLITALPQQRGTQQLIEHVKAFLQLGMLMLTWNPGVGQTKAEGAQVHEVPGLHSQRAREGRGEGRNERERNPLNSHICLPKMSFYYSNLP